MVKLMVKLIRKKIVRLDVVDDDELMAYSHRTKFDRSESRTYGQVAIFIVM